MSEPRVDELETQLGDLSTSLSWPQTPDLAGDVASRLAATSRAPGERHLAKFLLAAAVVIVVLSAAVAVWPTGRRAVADLLGLRGVHISTGPPPSIPATTTPTHLDLGTPISIADASKRLGFAVRVPTVAGFDHPDGVFFSIPPPQGEVTVLYLPRGDLPASAQTGVGLLLSEFEATMETGFFGKVAEPGTTIEALSIHAQPAYWLAGSPHAFFYRLANGDTYGDTLRLATNTLVWQAGAVTLRLEGDITKNEAVAIADSLP
jgi:hypothetical protein